MTKDWKYYLGICLIIYSCIPMLVLAVLPFLGLGLAKAGVVAAVFLASGEIAFLAAAALLGKEFLQVLKKKVLAWFRRQPGPIKPVSRTRHRAGVVLLVASVMPYYLVLLDLLFFSPKGDEITFLAWSLVASEVMFMISLFLLGDPFWEKLKHLFDWSGDQADAPAKTA